MSPRVSRACAPLFPADAGAGHLVRIVLAALVLMICLGLHPGLLLAQSGAQRPELAPASVFDFAEQNYDSGDFLAAAIEFKRFVHLFPDHPRAPEAAFYTGAAYFRMKRHVRAIEAFQKTAEQFPDSDYATEARFMVSRCHKALDNPGDAIRALNLIRSETSDPDVRDRASYGIGRVRLKTGDIAGARAAFASIRPANRGKYRVAQIMESLEHPGAIERKSPFLAGLLSILPGGGYLYCGRYREAATAFLVTAGLAAASWECFDADLEALGGITGFAGLGFYGGQMIGSVSAAHKYNRSRFEAYIDRLPVRRQGPLSLRIRPDGVMLAYCYRF